MLERNQAEALEAVDHHLHLPQELAALVGLENNIP
jgi:hypothetical protein